MPSMDPRWFVAQAVARILAGEVTDPSQTPYISALRRNVSGQPDAPVRPCTNCHRDCIIDPAMLHIADGSAGVICNECIQEITGKTMAEIVQAQLELLKKDRPSA